MNQSVVLLRVRGLGDRAGLRGLDVPGWWKPRGCARMIGPLLLLLLLVVQNVVCSHWAGLHVAIRFLWVRHLSVSVLAWG